MLKARTHLINFRVTEEEFHRLRDACDRFGARCLSDFARTMMLTEPTPHQTSDGSDGRYSTLEHRLSSIERSIAHILEAVADLQVKVATRLG